MRILIALLLCLFWSIPSWATDRVAASCTQAAVTAAYNLAVAGTSLAALGDTVVIPAGDCQTANRWSSYLVVSKAYVTIQGAGGTSTKIGVAGANSGIQVTTNGVRITGIDFNCNFFDTTNNGPVFWGTSSGNPRWHYTNLRLDHSTFEQCGVTLGAEPALGRNAMTITGWIDGVIDHNNFINCNSECINWCADNDNALTRSLLPGQWGNGTVFIEDNTFSTVSGQHYENIMDGNSGQRTVIRHNTINVANGAEYDSGISSTHETCAICSSSAPGLDVGSLVTEFYENDINLNNTGIMRDLQICRGGRCLIYNNRVTFTGSSVGRYGAGSWFSWYRSTSSYGCNTTMLHNRGWAAWVHIADGAFITTGRQATKTTLNGGITAGASTLTLVSSSGFNANAVANGYGITIGTEFIQWTGVSGNQLTGLVRGVNHSTAASHSNGDAVNYLMFGANITNGEPLEMPNNSYIWNNSINGVVSSALNDVHIYEDNEGSPTEYSTFDVVSCAVRPANCQYTEGGSGFSYTAYPYPHPLQGSGDTTPPAPPTNLRFTQAINR